MGRLRVAALAAFLLLVPTAGAHAELRAGAAAADITAPVGTPMFAYTARSKLADPEHLATPPQLLADPDPNLYAKSFVASHGIHTRILSRALVLQQGKTKLALAQADLGGLPYALTQSVLERIRSTGIDGDHLLLSATHTHSSTGPIWPADNLGYAGLGGDFFDPRIFELTAAGIAEAILRADGRLAPARAGTATVQVRNASRNRESEPFALNKDLASSPDTVNPDLTVLRVDDRKGRPLGLWSNFAIHPTSFGDGNLDFSGDNAGVAARLAEAAIGATTGRPVVDVWTNANEGDTSPNGDPSKLADGEVEQYVATDAAKADLAGERVAKGIVTAWQAAGARLRDDLALGARRSFLSFDGTEADGAPVGPIPVLGLGVVQEGQCAPVNDLAGPGQGSKMPLAGGPLLPTTFPVSLVRVGGLEIAAFPSEITKQMGTRIMRSVGAKAGADRIVIAGLTNAYASYTATPEEYDACTYEGSFTLFGRQQGARYRDFATALAAGAQPPGAGSEPPSTAFGAENRPSPRTTPDAGTVVTQPAAAVRRYARAVFAWKGGDPSIDAPRGATFVALQRRDEHGRWQQVATDDGFADITERTGDDTWTETFQLDETTAPGTYRFAVTGRADRGSGPEPYAVSSRTFTVAPLDLQAAAPTLAGGVASAIVRYPDPGASPLALPRLVRTGSARLRLTRSDGSTRVVTARPDAATGAFTAPAAGATAVAFLDARDDWGNRTP